MQQNKVLLYVLNIFCSTLGKPTLDTAIDNTVESKTLWLRRSTVKEMLWAGVCFFDGGGLVMTPALWSGSAKLSLRLSPVFHHSPLPRHHHSEPVISRRAKIEICSRNQLA